MNIEYKEELDESLKEFINNEFVNHSAKSNIICNYKSFNFIAKNENEVIGILKGHACYENAYIDDLIVIESHRRKGLGMKLIKKAEDYCKNNSFRSISLWTNKFQNTLKFYEKCGFKIEFTRENEENPKFTKYLLIKYF